jgi:hypothetical protein
LIDRFAPGSERETINQVLYQGIDGDVLRPHADSHPPG